MPPIRHCRTAPSGAIAFAATCAAYVFYLILIFFIRERSEILKTLRAVHRGGAGTATDRFLGLDIGGIGKARPGSVDAAMHLELGTLSAAHLAQVEGVTHKQPHLSDSRKSDPEVRMHAGKLSNASS